MVVILNESRKRGRERNVGWRACATLQQVGVSRMITVDLLPLQSRCCCCPGRRDRPTRPRRRGKWEQLVRPVRCDSTWPPLPQTGSPSARTQWPCRWSPKPLEYSELAQVLPEKSQKKTNDDFFLKIFNANIESICWHTAVQKLFSAGNYVANASKHTIMITKSRFIRNSKLWLCRNLLFTLNLAFPMPLEVKITKFRMATYVIKRKYVTLLNF